MQMKSLLTILRKLLEVAVKWEKHRWLACLLDDWLACFLACFLPSLLACFLACLPAEIPGSACLLAGWLAGWLAVLPAEWVQTGMGKNPGEK